MLIKKPADIRYSEVTPKALYLNRRSFLAGFPAAFLGARELLSPSARAMAGTKLSELAKSPLSTSEKENSYNDVTHYNNFYEFGVPKDQPAKNSQNFKTTPWTLSVEGDVAKPRKFSTDDLMHLAPLEERIYRHRCVEGWSIVVPWAGYSLSALLKLVEPTPKAKFVVFQSYFDSGQMPLAHNSGLQFPYVEGLRLDEAMHPLTMLTLGMYGETLPPQDGAPVRLSVPWKYGFKSAKSLVKIRLVDKQPPNTWNLQAPDEYGFYSNVNPAVDHPRWTQATEHRLGDGLRNRRPTLLFNGYGDQVASMYNGMDLKKFY